MAVTSHPWHKYITLTEPTCWWVDNGKWCGQFMVTMSTKMSYICNNGHETTYEELRNRKVLQ